MQQCRWELREAAGCGGPPYGSAKEEGAGTSAVPGEGVGLVPGEGVRLDEVARQDLNCGAGASLASTLKAYRTVRLR